MTTDPILGELAGKRVILAEFGYLEMSALRQELLDGGVEVCGAVRHLTDVPDLIAGDRVDCILVCDSYRSEEPAHRHLASQGHELRFLGI